MDIKLTRADFFVENGKHVFTFEASSPKFGAFVFPVIVPNTGKGISDQWFTAHDFLAAALKQALQRAEQLRDLSTPAPAQQADRLPGE